MKQTRLSSSFEAFLLLNRKEMKYFLLAINIKKKGKFFLKVKWNSQQRRVQEDFRMKLLRIIQKTLARSNCK